MGLYTFLYENLLYRLYIIHIQPPLLVTARLSRYTAHTAYTAIQPYTPYIIQRYTASLRGEWGWHEPKPLGHVELRPWGLSTYQKRTRKGAPELSLAASRDTFSTNLPH